MNVLLGAALKRIAELAAPGFIVRRARGGGDHVYLTFDDGPDAEVTPAILDVLRRYRVHATFFVLGQACEGAPEIVRQLIAEGHVVANHGYRHLLPSEAPGRRYIDNVLRCQRVIDEIAGRPLPRIFRPPHGVVGAHALWALWRHGYQVVLWSVDSRDSVDGATAELVASTLSPEQVGAGDIVLLHDDYVRTVTALPDVLAAFEREGRALAAYGAARAA